LAIELVGTEKRREKVFVLRELQWAIIYTSELSKQAIEDHVSTAFTVYWVNDGARLTELSTIVLACGIATVVNNQSELNELIDLIAVLQFN
jgi:hypothetical protein